MHSVTNTSNTCVLILSVTPKHSLPEPPFTCISRFSGDFLFFSLSRLYHTFSSSFSLIPPLHLSLRAIPLVWTLSFMFFILITSFSKQNVFFLVRDQLFQAGRIINHTYDLVYNCVCVGGSGVHMQVCEHLYVTLLMT